MSISWKEKAALSIRLLLDYAEANENNFRTPQEMFVEFSESLFTGTIDENGEDLTRLRWKSRSVSHSNSLISHVTNFSEWLYDNTSEESELLNPLVKATPHERICNLAAYHQRKSRAFLKHTFNDLSANRKAEFVHEVKGKKNPSNNEEVKKFDGDIAIKLMSEGFWKKSVAPEAPEQLNVRNVLITMLMHYGGLRVSEPFHLFLEDVYQDPDDPDLALIKVNHPILGDAPESWRKSHPSRRNDNRQAYLKSKFGLKDRLSSTSKKYHSGWKSAGFKSFYVYWFPRSAGVIWFKLFKYYIVHQRVHSDDCNNPFIFTNQYGHPASLSVFMTSHNKAVTKLGYKPKKSNGLTPHGHRHWYGDTLSDLGVDPLIIKKMMHHSSIESQGTYRATARDKEIRSALTKVEQGTCLDTTVRSSPLSFGFEDVDPLGLFSGSNPLLT